MHYFRGINDATISTISHSDALDDQSTAVADELVVLVNCDQVGDASTCHRLSGINEVVIGRGARREVERRAGHLSLKLADGRVSSTHATIVREGAAFVLVDTGSKNGVIVNGGRVMRHVLRDGDIFECGRTFFRYRTAQKRSPETPLDAEASGARSDDGIATFHEPLARQLRMLADVACTSIPVLILGATGTGKELVARAVHARSQRRGAFVGVNCGALPENLVEAELFGARRGAFTGATDDRPGLVRSSHEGTLFLDEIGELSARAQPTLLRVLQEHEILAVGATRPVGVDLRLVAATHRNLDALVQAGTFRADLLARISGVVVALPTLVERLDDFGILLSSLLSRHVAAGQALPSITPAAMRAMLRHEWPLNIRELEHAIRAALALSPARIDLEQLPAAVRGGGGNSEKSAPVTPPRAYTPEQEARRRELEALLVAHRGNISEVARQMNKDRVQIRRWIRMFGISIDELVR